MDFLSLFKRASAPVSFNSGRVIIYADESGRVWAKDPGTGSINELSVVSSRLLPAGGSSGQVLKKASGTDYDVTWSADLTEGGGGGIAWGAVTGTLADQTDLQTALNGKAASSHTHAASDITTGTIATARLGSGTANAGSALRGDQTWGAAWTIVKKTVDEQITSDAALGADATLKFALVANTKYRFRFAVFITSNSVPNFDFRLAGPASPSVVIFDQVISSATGSSHTLNSAYHAADQPVGFVSTSDALVVLEGIVHNGGNAGNLEFQWAQTTSNGAATTVRAGSSVEYSAF